MEPYKESELYGEFERIEDTKRQRLNYLMGFALIWNLLFVNFLIPKDVPKDAASCNMISSNSILLMQMNFGFFGLFVATMVYHIEGELMQAFNYFAFYLLYLAVIVPIYPAPKEIYIPIWLFVVGMYVMMCILMNSLPFILYPLSDRWQDLKRRYAPPPPMHQQQRPSPASSIAEQKAIISKEKIQ